MLLYLLSQVDYLSVLFAAVAGMVVGGIWYMPDVFGKAWMHALGRTQWNLGDPGQLILIRAGTTLITAFSLAVLMIGGGVTTFGGSLRLGAVVSLGIVATTMLSEFAFARWPWRLFFVTAGHRIVHIMTMCAVLGATTRLF
ncbi:MAG: DUF1761 family protein [Betaproteobacteria bacterium]|nr:DUF1761 family protein [Betaproteobacteria bacterium]